MIEFAPARRVSPARRRADDLFDKLKKPTSAKSKTEPGAETLTSKSARLRKLRLAKDS
jgi:hypothetical protein